jgi:hypothetical protein
MNIESLLNKIKIFKELVIDSGFKRDVADYRQSIGQAQNQNLVYMKELSEKIKAELVFFESNSLRNELKEVLRESKPFAPSELLEELEELDADKEISGQQYYQKINTILNKIQKSITSNETELDSLKLTFDKYVSGDDQYKTDTQQAIMSLVFKDLQSTSSIKEFSKVLHRWNRTLVIYHTLLKQESPEEISLIGIQNGSIDVIFNIDFEVAIDLTELIKIGLKVYGAYLLYKSRTAKEIIASYMGNAKLIASEKEREKLMLDNIKDSIKTKVLEQHKESLKLDSPPSKAGASKKADEVAKVITDHLIRGNELKLLTPPKPEEEETTDMSSELRIETAIVRERWKNLDEKEKQLLLDMYTIKEEDQK